MTTTMYEFNDQTMTVDAGYRSDHEPKRKSWLPRTFKKIRSAFTPDKKALDRGELGSKDARRAVELTLEGEAHKGKSLRRKLLEGLSPLSRSKRRRARENRMDTSSDSPSLAARGDLYENTMDCGVLEPQSVPACVGVNMVAEEDPVVSALADLMARLSISDTSAPPVTASPGDAVGAICAAISAERSKDLMAVSPRTTGYSPYTQRRRFIRNRGAVLPTVDDCLKALHEEELACMMVVEEPAPEQPVTLDDGTPGSPMDLDDASYASWDGASTLTTSTLSDTSTLVSPEDGDSSMLSLAKSLACLTLGKARAFVGNMALY